MRSALTNHIHRCKTDRRKLTCCRPNSLTSELGLLVNRSVTWLVLINHKNLTAAKFWSYNTKKLNNSYSLFTPPTRTRQNWKLGPDKTKLSRLVSSCVHTADKDKTGQFCLVRIGGVNKPLEDNWRIEAKLNNEIKVRFRRCGLWPGNGSLVYCPTPGPAQLMCDTMMLCICDIVQTMCCRRLLWCNRGS